MHVERDEERDGGRGVGWSMKGGVEEEGEESEGVREGGRREGEWKVVEREEGMEEVAEEARVDTAGQGSTPVGSMQTVAWITEQVKLGFGMGNPRPAGYSCPLPGGHSGRAARSYYSRAGARVSTPGYPQTADRGLAPGSSGGPPLRRRSPPRCAGGGVQRRGSVVGSPRGLPAGRTGGVGCGG